MIILHLETSTQTCSVALSENEHCIFNRAAYGSMNHAKLLHPFIQEALDLLLTKNARPDAIAVSSGPGSYTGLRIGVSAAKGLCYGYDIPLIAVPTLEIMALEMIHATNSIQDALYIPMIDARRMEVYDLITDAKLNCLRETKADIIGADTFQSFENKKLIFGGNGSEKCKSVLPYDENSYLPDIHPLAIRMIPIANQKYLAHQFEDVAYYEPFYLKEFVGNGGK